MEREFVTLRIISDRINVPYSTLLNWFSEDGKDRWYIQPPRAFIPANGGMPGLWDLDLFMAWWEHVNTYRPGIEYGGTDLSWEEFKVSEEVSVRRLMEKS